MEKDFTPTAFDSHLQNHTLQILKTAIPYIPTERQCMLATIIKVMELSLANSLFEKEEPALQMCEGQSSSARMLQMLDAIRPLCDSSSQSSIDLITNMVSMYDLYGTMMQGGTQL
ncbi:MAG: hypothetical protein PUD20_04065 [bacterium]|nr:hypothetical protein [bacterium]